MYICIYMYISCTSICKYMYIYIYMHVIINPLKERGNPVGWAIYRALENHDTSKHLNQTQARVIWGLKKTKMVTCFLHQRGIVCK